jgi:cryptochrome
VQQLCYEVDIEPYARTRDAAVDALAEAAGVQVSAHVSHTLYVSRLAWASEHA